MKTNVKWIAGMMAILLILGAIMLPASASASSSKAVSKYSSLSTTSFLSSLAEAVSSVFSKNTHSSSQGGGNNSTGSNSLLNWLKGNKPNGNNNDDKWNGDSNKIWEKWYCY